jgi:hypothetical protein
MINVSIDTTAVEAVKRELINQLKSKIKQAHIETVCREQYGINSIEGYECIDGDLVIDNDQVAFKLDFEVRFPVSLLINTDGNNDTTSSEVDDNLPSEDDSSLDLIEPEEIDEAMDDELPDIDFKDM